MHDIMRFMLRVESQKCGKTLDSSEFQDEFPAFAQIEANRSSTRFSGSSGVSVVRP